MCIPYESWKCIVINEKGKSHDELGKWDAANHVHGSFIVSLQDMCPVYDSSVKFNFSKCRFFKFN